MRANGRGVNHFIYRVGEPMTVKRLGQYRGARYLSPDAFDETILVTVSGHENNRDAAQLAEHPRGLDAVAGAIQINVNDRDIGRVLHREGNGLTRVRGKTADFEAQLIQISFQTKRDENLIFNDECVGAQGGA